MRREVREFSDAGADEMPEELRSVSVQRFSENVNICWKAYGGISDMSPTPGHVESSKS